MNLGFFFSLKISKYFVNGVHKNCERRSQNCERRSQFQIVNGSARHPNFLPLSNLFSLFSNLDVAENL